MMFSSLSECKMEGMPNTLWKDFNFFFQLLFTLNNFLYFSWRYLCHWITTLWTDNWIKISYSIQLTVMKIPVTMWIKKCLWRPPYHWPHSFSLRLFGTLRVFRSLNQPWAILHGHSRGEIPYCLHLVSKKSRSVTLTALLHDTPALLCARELSTGGGVFATPTSNKGRARNS